MHMGFSQVANATFCSIPDANEHNAPIFRGVGYGMLFTIPLWGLIVMAVFLLFNAEELRSKFENRP
jgi:hypothetical protein